MLHKRLQRVLDKSLTSPRLTRNRNQERRDRTKSMPIDIAAYFSTVQSTPQPSIQPTPYQLIRSGSELGLQELDLSVDTVMTPSGVRNSMTSSFDELNRCFSMNVSVPSGSIISMNSNSSECDSVWEVISNSPISEIYIDKAELVEYQLGLREDMPQYDSTSADELHSENGILTQSSESCHLVNICKYCRNVNDCKQTIRVNQTSLNNLSRSSDSLSDLQVEYPCLSTANDNCMLNTEKTQYNEIKGFSAGRKHYEANSNTATLNSDTRCNHIALKSHRSREVGGVISCTNPCTICKHCTACGVSQTVTDRCTCITPVAAINNKIPTISVAADKQESNSALRDPLIAAEPVNKNTYRIKSDLYSSREYIGSDLSQSKHSSDFIDEDYSGSYSADLNSSYNTTSSEWHSSSIATGDDSSSDLTRANKTVNFNPKVGPYTNATCNTLYYVMFYVKNDICDSQSIEKQNKTF